MWWIETISFYTHTHTHTVVVKRQSLQKSQLLFLVIVLKRDGFVPQWLELMEEESSLCFAFCPTETDFLLSNPSHKRWKLKVKESVVPGHRTASSFKSGSCQPKVNKSSCLLVLESNNFQVARRVCLELTVISLTSLIQADKLNLRKSGDINGERRWKQKTRLLY